MSFAYGTMDTTCIPDIALVQNIILKILYEVNKYYNYYNITRLQDYKYVCKYYKIIIAQSLRGYRGCSHFSIERTTPWG